VEASDACSSARLGAVTRTALAPAAPFGGVFGAVVDPDDDLLLVLAIPAPGDGTPAAISAADLGTRQARNLTIGGDSRVDLGEPSTASITWDPINHRAIVLGGADDEEPNAPPDTSQVYSIRVQGTEAILSLLPDFPDGPTNAGNLAAVIDSSHARLLAVAAKLGTPGATATYALDLSGTDSWSLLDTDDQAALQSLEIVGLTYDPGGQRVLGIATSLYSSDAPPTSSLWALSLDSPSGWTPLSGSFPPPISTWISWPGAPDFVWDDTACGFVASVSSATCLYDVWRMNVGAADFTFEPLGVAIQPDIRYGRGTGLLDAKRQNVVFFGGDDCQYNQSFPATSIDFVPLLH